MRITFVGCGDAFGSGGRFNTCSHVAGRGTFFLIDCGATSLVALRRAGIDHNAIETIFVTISTPTTSWGCRAWCLGPASASAALP